MRSGAEGRTGPPPSPAVRIALWAPAGWVVLFAALVIAGPVLPVPTAAALGTWAVSLVLPLAALPALRPRHGPGRPPAPPGMTTGGHPKVTARSVVPPAGFEPAAFCSGGRRSIP